MFDRFGDARVVLLGEASHGTIEFYRARAAISQRLIERHGFSIVAVEADWPDAATIDRYVRHRPRARGQFKAFERFPTWMWRNTDVDAFIRWMRRHNQDRADERDGRLLRPRPLQSRRLDAGGDRVPRRARPRARPARAQALRLPRAVGRQPADVRPILAARRLCAVRGRGRADAEGPAPAARRLPRAASATNGSTPRPTPGW